MALQMQVLGPMYCKYLHSNFAVYMQLEDRQATDDSQTGSGEPVGVGAEDK